MNKYRRSYTNSQKLDILFTVNKRKANGEKIIEIAKSLQLSRQQIYLWSRSFNHLSTSRGLSKQVSNHRSLLAACDKQLLQWLLDEGRGASIKTIGDKASTLDPKFGEKSEKDKDTCIRRFLKEHNHAINRESLSVLPVRGATAIQQPTIPAQAKVLQGKQFSINDENSPVLPPDIIAGMEYASADEARRRYKVVQVNSMRKRNQSVPGALYRNMIEGYFLVLDHAVIGDFDIHVTYSPQSASKSTTVTTVVRVRSARDDSNYLRALLLVDTQLKGNRHVVRQGHGDIGTMWQLGIKNRGIKEKKLYKATESSACNDIPLLPMMNTFMSSFFRTAFPIEFSEIQAGNKDIGINDYVGGDGSLQTFSISCDLGNASHIDCGDESVGISTWVEEKPGTAKNWFFILPNTTLMDDPSKAVVIKLSHGLSIGWNGKVLHHCTSLTDTGEMNHVYGNFTSKSKARSLG
jgi:transposase